MGHTIAASALTCNTYVTYAVPLAHFVRVELSHVERGRKRRREVSVRLPSPSPAIKPIERTPPRGTFRFIAPVTRSRRDFSWQLLSPSCLQPEFISGASFSDSRVIAQDYSIRDNLSEEFIKRLIEALARVAEFRARNLVIFLELFIFSFSSR